MSWFKIDDKFHSHPKVMQAGNAAIGLWTRCASYAAANLTDGFIPHAIASLYGTKPQRNALVSSRLWVPVDGGYQMHDYTDMNPTREQVLAQRKATAERVTRWRSNGVTNTVTNGVTHDDVTALVTPPPTRPDPTRSTYSHRDTSTTSTGVRAAAVDIYAKADMAKRSVTDIRNARSYQRTIARNALAEHGQAIADYLESYPAATAVDVAVEVLGIDPYDARCAWAELHPGDEAS